MLLTGGGVYGYLKLFSKKFISPVSDILPTPLLESQEMATWVDQSEFSFQYPKNLKLNPHDEDEENYAHIELSSATNAGNLVIWVKDTEASDIDEWVKQIKAKNAIDSTLGGEMAKKILITNGTQKITVATIRNGYLYQIDVELTDAAFWNKIYETVVSSFKFVEPSVQKNNTSSHGISETSTNEDYSEDEEWIE